MAVGEGRRFDSGVRLVVLAGLLGVLVALVGVPVFAGIGMAAKSAADQVAPVRLDQPPLPQISRILAADGSTLATFYYQNRTDVGIDQIAPVMQEAIVAVEDSRFYEHGALDLKGTVRALVRNQTSGTVVQGGSSLTQQYVKNVLFESAGTRAEVASGELDAAGNAKAKAAARGALRAAQREQIEAVAPSVARKLQELRYAVWVEEHYTKPEILARYLNIAFFGHQTYGVQAAAERYFSVPAADLSLAQAATLAGMVNNAVEFDPTSHPLTTLKRRNVVLERMAQVGDITLEQARKAEAQPLTLAPSKRPGGCDGVRYAYFCTYVQDEILSDPVFGATTTARRMLLDTGGLTIRTTLDPHVQNAAQRAVDGDSGLNSSKITMEAMVEPGTGKIKAIAISRRFGIGHRRSSIDYAADQAHGGGAGVQAGSTFKLFTMTAALQNGYGLDKKYDTPSSMRIDGFTTCSGRHLPAWSVRNAEETKDKSMDMRTAMEQSINTYFAQLERDVGLCKVARTAAALGMRAPDGSQLQQVPAFTLGSDEIDIVHEAAAYATFGARGRYCAPLAVTSVSRTYGADLHVPQARCRQAVDAAVSDQVTDVLRGVLTHGTAKGNTIPGTVAAGKTGTTENRVTAVFAGYTPRLSAVLWNGDPAAPFGDPVGRYGASLAPVWVRSLENALNTRSS